MAAASSSVVGEMRFQVLAPGLAIGRFSECTGLEMEYDVLEYAEGGGLAPHKLRGPLRYPNLTLTRGITHEPALLEWFRLAQDARSRPTITVALLGDDGAVLRHWAFAAACPVRWKGPSMNAGSARVAAESLEIAHAGLVPTSAGGAAPDGGDGRPLVRGFERARLEIEGGVEVWCWFNPNAYVVSAVGGGAGRELQLSLLFDASDHQTRDVQGVCESIFAAIDAGDAGGRAPAVTFAWGDAPPFRAVAKQVSVRYSLFDVDGTPLRAHVELRLAEAGDARAAARGAPAGVAGVMPSARTHTLRAGDDLQSIAHEVYKDAAKWRAIAEANGIDDPLRLPPRGTVLRLPRVPRPEASSTTPTAPQAETPLGGGVAFPLRTDAQGALAVLDDDAQLDQAIGVILTTPPGERRATPAFGCDLRQFVHERMDGRSIGALKAEVRDALARWEPRIDVLQVACEISDPRVGRLSVDITYTVRATGAIRTVSHTFFTIPEEMR